MASIITYLKRNIAIFTFPLSRLKRNTMIVTSDLYRLVLPLIFFVFLSLSSLSSIIERYQYHDYLPFYFYFLIKWKLSIVKVLDSVNLETSTVINFYFNWNTFWHLIISKYQLLIISNFVKVDPSVIFIQSKGSYL